MQNKLLNVNEVASILDLKPARIYELSREGKLPFLVRIGDRQYRYHAQGMQNWLLSGGNADQNNGVKNNEQK